MNKTNDFKFNLPAYSDPVDIEDLNDNFRGIDDALMAGLCKKDYTGNNMGSSDPSARKYAWAPWFEIVNDNEFDVVVTDRNAPVESEEATINIAAGQTFRKYINGRYYMNFYVQDQHDVTFKWFTNAETYINESGGGGGGTGTVTSVSVQGGSGSHLTGSGNPIETSGTITINVDDGYSIPSDNEQTAWDGKAADLKAEIDSSTYVLTLQLKDSAGNLIGTAKTIDLPLETMVVDGEYDSQTKKIKLELKNGNYVEFSVADLVSGLQTELSASNKLDPAYIDYDSSHRAVSDTEKTTWNGKQNAISDLETIRSGAAAGATAVQPSAMQTALSTKQDSLDNTQLAAVNSGINSTKVTQIETNKTNILYGIDKVGKNLINTFDLDTIKEFNVTGTWSGNEYARGNARFTIKDDGTIGVKTVAQTSGDSMFYLPVPVMEDNGSYMLSGCPEGGSGEATNGYLLDYQYQRNGNTIYIIDTGDSHSFTYRTTDTAQQLIVIVRNQTTISSEIIFKPMICLKTIYDADPTYSHSALPNYDLTRLESEDRAALAEEIDAGAKNKLKINSYTSTGGVGRYGRDDSLSIPAGDYILIAKVNQTANAAFTLVWDGTQHDFNVNGSVSNTVKIWNVKATNTITSAWVYFNATNNTWTDVMLCTKAAFGVSNKFVPYRMNYDELIDFTTAKSVTSTNFFTPNANYEIASTTKIYKQGNHIYGNIVLHRKSGYIPINNTESTGAIKPAYYPAHSLPTPAYLSTSEWSYGVLGYGFISNYAGTGDTIVKATHSEDENKYNYVTIPLNYTY